MIYDLRNIWVFPTHEVHIYRSKFLLIKNPNVYLPTYWLKPLANATLSWLENTPKPFHKSNYDSGKVVDMLGPTTTCFSRNSTQ